MKNYFAIDLGATSGRTIIGTLDNGHVSMEALTRFDNPLIALDHHLYWDLYALYHEIIKGLQMATQRGITIQSIGIDTWGCDFALFGDDGALFAQPAGLSRPAYQWHDGTVFCRKDAKEGSICPHRHPVYELQQPLPALCHAAAW